MGRWCTQRWCKKFILKNEVKTLLKTVLTQQWVDDVLEDGDEDEDENGVGHLDGVRKKFEAFAQSRFHSGRLEGPGWTLETFGKQILIRLG